MIAPAFSNVLMEKGHFLLLAPVLAELRHALELSLRMCQLLLEIPRRQPPQLGLRAEGFKARPVLAL